jgi:flagellar basal body rod protein FlgG
VAAPEPVVDRLDAVAVVQGYVEGSNVNAIGEMTQLIQVTRAFEGIASQCCATARPPSNEAVQDTLACEAGRN